MTEQQLHELLKRKSDVTVTFSKSEAEFTKEFFAKIKPPVRRRFSPGTLAAAASLLLAVAGMILWQRSENQPSAPPQTAHSTVYQRLNESLRLFGSDAAVLFFGDELVTGDRESDEAPVNLIELVVKSGARKINLALACSDSDSIYIDTPEVSGNVIISRSDASTLVVDLELMVKGRKIHTIIPVSKQSGKNCYEQGTCS